MSTELAKEARQEALASLERYCRENLEEPLGNLAVNSLLNFFVQEIGPLIYNQAVADVQERLQARIADLDLEVHADEFPYWRQQKPARRR